MEFFSKILNFIYRKNELHLRFAYQLPYFVSYEVNPKNYLRYNRVQKILEKVKKTLQPQANH